DTKESDREDSCLAELYSIPVPGVARSPSVFSSTSFATIFANKVRKVIVCPPRLSCDSTPSPEGHTCSHLVSTRASLEWLPPFTCSTSIPSNPLNNDSFLSASSSSESSSSPPVSPTSHLQSEPTELLSPSTFRFGLPSSHASSFAPVQPLMRPLKAIQINSSPSAPLSTCPSPSVSFSPADWSTDALELGLDLSSPALLGVTAEDESSDPVSLAPGILQSTSLFVVNPRAHIESCSSDGELKRRVSPSCQSRQSHIDKPSGICGRRKQRLHEPLQIHPPRRQWPGSFNSKTGTNRTPYRFGRCASFDRLHTLTQVFSSKFSRLPNRRISLAIQL
ncbi:unnamed protein product, partial [Protopolystoma xenopodis]